MPLSIKEGELEFIFSEDVFPTKYDGWVHYRKQFKDKCYKDNKAVDFIVYNSDKAWFCEIKDFRQNDRNKEKIPLCDEIALKVRDTLAGLVSAKLRANNTEEKNFAKEVLTRSTINIILHIEQPNNSPYYNLSDLKDKLRQLLKAIDPHVKVMNRTHSFPNIPWSVT
jgi:identified by metaGeneAnnotator